MSDEYDDDDYDEFYDLLRTCIEDERTDRAKFISSYIIKISELVWDELNDFCKGSIKAFIEFDRSNGTNKDEVDAFLLKGPIEWNRTVDLPPARFESREYYLYCLAAGLYHTLIVYDEDEAWDSAFNHLNELKLSPEAGFKILSELGYA